MPSSLTTTESSHLAGLEQVIEAGKRTFVEVGRALSEIRDSRLYRATHNTFEAYCRDKWGWNSSRARQLISASEVQESVTTVTLTSERQARELSRVEPERRAEVIEAVSAAGPVTARAIRQEARRRRPMPEPEEPPRVVTAQEEMATRPTTRLAANTRSRKATMNWWKRAKPTQRWQFLDFYILNNKVEVPSKDELRQRLDSWVENWVVETAPVNR